MTIKDIGIHVDHTEQSKVRIKTGFELAKRLGANVTALYCQPEAQLPSYSGYPIAITIIDQLDKTIEQQANEAQALFDEVAANYEVQSSWRKTHGDVIQNIALESRIFDLIILGQAHPDHNQGETSRIVDHILLEAGRPCLVLPYTYQDQEFGRNSLITWNGSRESSRAIHDALPLLKLGDKALLVVSDPSKTSFSKVDMPGTLMASHLARHDIEVELKLSYSDDIKTSENLLSLACDEGADMIVMGAYGHSRFRELVLGGMTREILSSMTVPVFMSH